MRAWGGANCVSARVISHRSCCHPPFSYLGHIDLGTVTEVRACTRVDAPPHALDLVTDARVFSLAPATAELMQEWRHRIHAVVGVVTVYTRW